MTHTDLQYAPFCLFVLTLIPILLFKRQFHGRAKSTRKTSSGRQAHVSDETPLSFSVTMLWGPWEVGGSVTTRHILLSEQEVEDKLTAERSSTLVDRPGNFVTSYYTSSVASRNNEDRIATHTVSSVDLERWRIGYDCHWTSWGKFAKLLTPQGDRVEDKYYPSTDVKDPAPKSLPKGDGSGDISIFTVADGHAGGHISQLLKTALHPVLLGALAPILRKSWDDALIKETLTKAVLDFDDQLRSAVNLVLGNQAVSNAGLSSAAPFDFPAAFMYLATLEDGGSCFSTVILDSKQKKMIAINVGDCRAVAGWWNPRSQQWRCDVLSEIGENCDNAFEAARMRAEHPDEDPEHVVCDRGNTHRILADCQPSRAMADSNIKRDIKEWPLIEEAFQFAYHRPPNEPINNPYLSAEPEVIIRDLRSSDEQLKFVVLAVDGLWDLLSSEEAVLLTSAYLSKPGYSTIPKSQLPQLVPQTPPKADRPYPVEDLPGTTVENSEGTWTFNDQDGPAIHLIRNAIGYGDPWLSRRVLSMNDGMVKSMRDDIATIVICLGESNLPA